MVLKDIVQALQAMVRGFFGFIVDFLKFASIGALIIGAVWCMAWLGINYPFQSMAIMVMVGLFTWFMVELDIARWEREQEEKDSNGSKN